MYENCWRRKKFRKADSAQNMLGFLAKKNVGTSILKYCRENIIFITRQYPQN